MKVHPFGTNIESQKGKNRTLTRFFYNKSALVGFSQPPTLHLSVIAGHDFKKKEERRKKQLGATKKSCFPVCFFFQTINQVHTQVGSSSVGYAEIVILLNTSSNSYLIHFVAEEGMKCEHQTTAAAKAIQCSQKNDKSTPNAPDVRGCYQHDITTCHGVHLLDALHHLHK